MTSRRSAKTHCSVPKPQRTPRLTQPPIEAGSMAEVEDHDVSDAMTVAEPDEEALK